MTHSHSFDAATLCVQQVQSFGTDVKSNKWKLQIPIELRQERDIHEQTHADRDRESRERMKREEKHTHTRVSEWERKKKKKYCRYLFVNGFPGVKSFNLVL